MDNFSSICNSSLSDNVRSELVAVFSSGGFLGVLSCSAAISLLLFFKMYKSFSERLVLYQLLSALFVAIIMALMIIGVGLDFDKHHGLCQAISFLVQCSVWNLLLFTTIIVIHLASLVFFYKKINRFKMEPVFVIFALTFPLLFSWIPFLHDTYGLSGAWCWIRVYHHSECTYYYEGLIEQYALWYAPFSLILLVNSIVTIAISVVLCHRAFKKRPDRTPTVNAVDEKKPKVVKFEEPKVETESDRYKKVLKNSLPLLAYPIIYNISSWFTLANRIRRAIFPGGSYATWIIHAIAAPTWASLAGIVFIIFIIAKKKFAKHSIVKAAHSWRKTFTRLSKKPVQQDSIKPPAVTDVLTKDGYTEVCPTEYEPPPESEFDESVLSAERNQT